MELGCGLFGLAFELEQDFRGTLKKLADAGFTAVEPLYSFPMCLTSLILLHPLSLEL